MFMLWMGNVLATFQTELTPTYKPMDRFQKWTGGEATGRAGRSAEGIPKKIPLGISQEFSLSNMYVFLFHLF